MALGRDGELCGLGFLNLALVLAVAMLPTNMTLCSLAYRLTPVLPGTMPAETLYEIRLGSTGISLAARRWLS
jgi:hypothetical protein